MTPKDISTTRLIRQQIARQSFKKPEQVVSWMGAIQAQDYPGGVWGVGLRTSGSTITDVEKAIATGKIVRTWPMRGTLHFVAAQDVAWMIDLSAPKILPSSVARWQYLHLTDEIVSKARKVTIKALEGGKRLTRKEFYGVLEKNGIDPGGSRGLHLIGRMALEKVICMGPHQGKQATVVLFDEWIPTSTKFTREESLAEFAKRYFTSHGPATLEDFVWWAGLRITDARRGIELNGTRLHKEIIGEKTYYLTGDMELSKIASPDVHILPPFDEYLVAYKDRSAAIDLIHTPKVFRSANGVFSPVVVIDGKVEGIWKRVVQKNSVICKPEMFLSLKGVQEKALTTAIDRYHTFLLESSSYGYHSSNPASATRKE